jgi:nucleoside-diphosphate-sugar epimerase
MRILITGGTGNLAEFLVKELEGEHELVLFDRVAPGEGRFTWTSSHPFVAGDLTVGEDCARAVAGCQAVMHLGAIPWASDVATIVERLRSEGRPIPPPEETMRVNTMGTYHLLREAARASVGVVLCVTSNCVLGHCMGRPSGRQLPIDYLPIDEEHPTDVEESYGISKQFQEQLLAGYTKLTGMRSYAIRPSALHRPERLQELAKNAAPTTEWSVRLLNGYADIAETARALRLCFDAHRDLPPYDAYYINAPDTIALEESRELVARLRPDLLSRVRDLPGHAAFISNAKARRAFGYRPESSWRRYHQGNP